MGGLDRTTSSGQTARIQPGRRFASLDKRGIREVIGSRPKQAPTASEISKDRHIIVFFKELMKNGKWKKFPRTGRLPLSDFHRWAVYEILKEDENG